ncbi:hypothetical protein Btru_056470 [Bulinus truncatus]|nr:hypothetical protein Btru_056470 [Bulinus truncatus]
MKDQRQDLDEMLTRLNPHGVYQMLQMSLMFLVMFPAAYQLLGNIFINKHVPHSCARGNKSDMPRTHETNVSYGQCHLTIWLNQTMLMKSPCPSGVKYPMRITTSTVSQFNLVCDRINLARLSQTLVIAGQAVGAIVGTMLSDKFGRKLILVASNVGLLVSGLAIAFAPTYTTFAAFKFIAGGFQQGTITTSATLCLELFPSNDRRITAVVFGLVWSAAAMTLALFAFLLHEYSWRVLQAALSCSSCLVLLQIWFLDESPRWLMANSKNNKAFKILQKAAKLNGKDPSVISQMNSLSEVYNKDSSNHEQDNTTPSNSVGRSLSLVDVFRDRRLFKNSLILWLAWFTTALSYFVIYLTSTSLSGNPYVNYFLTALMEIPANVFFYFSLNKLGRRITTMVPFALLGISILLSGIFKHLETNDHVYNIWTLVTSLLSMVGASGSFGVVYLYTPEMFPTNLRNQALGLSSSFARLGGMIAPFMGLLAELAIWAPGLLMAVLSGLVCVLLIFLPETSGRELPQTMEEFHQWSQKKTSV